MPPAHHDAGHGDVANRDRGRDDSISLGVADVAYSPLGQSASSDHVASARDALVNGSGHCVTRLTGLPANAPDAFVSARVLAPLVVSLAWDALSIWHRVRAGRRLLTLQDLGLMPALDVLNDRSADDGGNATAPSNANRISPDSAHFALDWGPRPDNGALLRLMTALRKAQVCFAAPRLERDRVEREHPVGRNESQAKRARPSDRGESDRAGVAAARAGQAATATLATAATTPLDAAVREAYLRAVAARGADAVDESLDSAATAVVAAIEHTRVIVQRRADHGDVAVEVSATWAFVPTVLRVTKHVSARIGCAGGGGGGAAKTAPAPSAAASTRALRGELVAYVNRTERDFAAEIAAFASQPEPERERVLRNPGPGIAICSERSHRMREARWQRLCAAMAAAEP